MLFTFLQVAFISETQAVLASQEYENYPDYVQFCVEVSTAFHNRQDHDLLSLLELAKERRRNAARVLSRPGNLCKMEDVTGTVWYQDFTDPTLPVIEFIHETTWRWVILRYFFSKARLNKSD